MKNITEFMSGFNFNPELAGQISCEREMFLFNRQGEIVPWAPKALQLLDDPSMCFELSACQIESRVGPVSIESLNEDARRQQAFISSKLAQAGMSVRYLSVAPENMPLDVYPDARYLGIADRISPNALISACRVAGTHFHVGMPDWETALEVYNRAVDETYYLINLGNRTNGERIRIYAGMAKDFMPRTYRSVDDLFDNFCLNGLADNPRGCYHLIRISVHGTIEFRMFDNTDDPDDIDFWGRSCLEVCGDFAKNLAGV